MRHLKEMILENWYLKLFSLVIAAALWALIAQESLSEIFFDVPVEYQNVPPRTEVIGDTAKTVQVRLDATNVFNHPVPNSPNVNLNSTNPFGFIQDKGNQIRQFRGQLRLNF